MRFSPSAPLQLSMVKRQAKVLALWCGLPPALSQEITARAYSATSWQALLGVKEFVPDEALVAADEAAGRGLDLLEGRYALLAELLAKQLNVERPHSLALAAAWQPTALRPSFLHQLHLRRQSRLRPNEESLEIRQIFEAPGLLELEVVPALALDLKELFLVLVPRARLTRFVSKASVLVLEPGTPQGEYRHSSPALHSAWQTHMDNPKTLLNVHSLIKERSRLARALSKMNVSALGEQAGQVRLLVEQAEKAGPVKTKSAWPCPVLDPVELAQAFATRFPWRAQDFPGVAPGQEHVFWSKRLPGFILQGAVTPAGICFNAEIEEPYLGNTLMLHSQAPAGEGVLDYFEASRDCAAPGFYLVKRRNQLRGKVPLPGMTEALAEEIRVLTGLEGGGHLVASVYEFISSEAGLALTKWVATFHTRALNAGGRGYPAYVGDWLLHAQLRMEFELLHAPL
jgi:hypothetical protein